MGNGFCIFVNSTCDGQVPLELDGNGKPVVYPTLLEAQQVIAEDVIERLEQFRRGEKDFEDAIFIEVYIEEVDVFSDGCVAMREPV